MTRNEMLSVGLMLGLVGALSTWAVMDARERARDIARLAHVRDLQLSLEFYFSDRATYPVVTEALALGQAGSACLGEDGFSGPCATGGARPYLSHVPVPPAAGLKGRVTCGDLTDVYCYQGAGTQYRLTFELENGNSGLGLAKGANCATETGLRPGVCEVLSD
jgi:hypothetical protein